MKRKYEEENGIADGVNKPKKSKNKSNTSNSNSSNIGGIGSIIKQSHTGAINIRPGIIEFSISRKNNKLFALLFFAKKKKK